MAYALADYGGRLWTLSEAGVVGLAVAAIVIVTGANALGVVVGKTTQNLLTVAKVLGLVGVVAAGFLGTGAATPVVDQQSGGAGSLGLAMVFVLYAYGGWNDAAFVAAEVRDRRRDIPRALFGGLAVVTLIYLAINFAYLRVLGFAGAQASSTPAADVMQQAVGPIGGEARERAGNDFGAGRHQRNDSHRLTRLRDVGRRLSSNGVVG